MSLLWIGAGVKGAAKRRGPYPTGGRAKRVRGEKVDEFSRAGHGYGGDMENSPETGRPATAGAAQPRTGAEQPWDPEDLAVAKGQDPTPGNVERSRQELDRDGPAAIEKTVP
jgi:hypothetical protein